MECEWDVGAFGDAAKDNSSQPFGPGPMFFRDCGWPMAGQHVWVAGRWIYDCGHPNKKGLARSELHPSRAIASARWEAAKFKTGAKVLWPQSGFLLFPPFRLRSSPAGLEVTSTAKSVESTPQPLGATESRKTSTDGVENITRTEGKVRPLLGVKNCFLLPFTNLSFFLCLIEVEQSKLVR